MADPMPLKFDFLKDGRVVRSERIELPVIRVGKLASSQLRIDDPSVARMHAVIEVHGSEQVELIDLGSSLGTVVNGERVERRSLQSGDRIQFGDTLIKVYVGADDILASEQAPSLPDASMPAGVVAPAAAAGAAPAPAPAAPRSASEQRLRTDPVLHVLAQRQAAYEAQMASEAVKIQVDDERRQAVEVTFLWGDTVQSVQHYTDARDITIGDNLRCDYPVDPTGLGSDSFPLIKAVGTAYALTFSERMSGQVRLVDGQTLSLRELRESGRAIPSADAAGAARFLLPDGARARVQYDEVTFLVNVVPAPRRQIYPWLPPITFPEAVTMVVAALGWLVFLVLAFLAIPDIEGFRLDSFDASNRFVSLIVMPERQDEADVPDWFKEMNKEKEKKSAPKAKGAEGKMGKKDSNQTDKKFAVKGPKDNKEVELRREEIRRKVVQTGALAALSAPSEELSAIWGRSDRAIGSDAVHAIGNWTGAGVGHARGFGGLGLSGTGRGGGGVSEGSLGVGGLGTQGRAGGKVNYGRGVGNLGDRSGRVPQVIPGKAVVTGSLDREIIRRIIGKHRAEVKYCYEKELSKHKDLMGKVVVTFVIAPTGQVVKATIRESSMNNSAVEQCIVARVKRWVFPQPKGGGIVEVTYPFIFKAT